MCRFYELPTRGQRATTERLRYPTFRAVSSARTAGVPTLTNKILVNCGDRPVTWTSEHRRHAALQSTNRDLRDRDTCRVPFPNARDFFARQLSPLRADGPEHHRKPPLNPARYYRNPQQTFRLLKPTFELRENFVFRSENIVIRAPRGITAPLQAAPKLHIGLAEVCSRPDKRSRNDSSRPKRTELLRCHQT
jgi:hypothetical protein